MLGGFIGVDFSCGKIRTVTVKRGLKGTEVSRAGFPEAGGGDAAGFLRDRVSAGTRAVAGISFSPLLLRVLSFPFRDPKKLRNVYRFELENSTGFALGEDTLSDYHEIRRQEGADLIVPAFRREAFEDYLESLREKGMEPYQVTFSPVAFSALDRFLGGERPLLLVDADAEHLNFSFFDRDGLSRVRNCDSAVGRMKTALSADALDFDAVSGDPEKRNAFLESLRFVAGETRNTARFFESSAGEEIRTFVLTGGICAVPGVAQRLSELLGREVETIFIDDLGAGDSPLYARAYALALYGSAPGGEAKLNLKRNGYGTNGSLRSRLKEFRLPAALCAALLMVIVFARTTEVVSARNKISSIRTEMQKDLRQEFPGASGVSDPVAFYRGKLEGINRRLDLLKQVRGSHSPLEVLRAVSAAVPAVGSFSLDEISIEDGGRASIGGRCETYEEAASIEKAFSESEAFSQVKMGQVAKAVGGGLKFQISMVAK